MNRTIDADALTKRFVEFCNKNCPYTAKARNVMCGSCFMGLALEAVEDAPTIEPQRKTGKWIERNPQNSDKCRLIECDKCGFSHIVGFNVPYEHWIENRNFCERCGADMRGDKDEQR